MRVVWAVVRDGLFVEAAMTQPRAVQFFAHSLLGSPQCDWEPLEDHLHQVAELAERFVCIKVLMGFFGEVKIGKAGGS